MKVKRLSIEQEKDLMHDVTDELNLNTIKTIKQYFFLDQKSESNVDRIIGRYLYPQEAYIDNLLELNSQRRAFYEVLISEDEDYGYGVYKDFIINAFSSMKNELISYEVYKSGKIIIDNKPRKLFRYLLQSGIINQEQIDILNRVRIKKDRLLIGVSRNPIDYLMIATNQNFVSCCNYDSTGIACYFMLNIGAIADPNRFLIFTTDGLLRRYLLKNKEIKHFKYISRAWSLSLDKDFYLFKVYPDSHVSFVKFLDLIGIRTVDKYTTIRQKFEFRPLKFNIKNKYVVPFIDKPITFDIINGNCIYKLIDTLDIKYPQSAMFRSEYRFNDIQQIQQLGYVTNCSKCKCFIHYDNVYSSEYNDKPLCEECFNEEIISQRGKDYIF